MRQAVHQLHHVLEIGEGRVPAALIEVGDERRTVGRHEHRGVLADLHAARRIAGVLDVAARCMFLHDPPRQTPREIDHLALDPAPGLGKALEGPGELVEGDADLTEDHLGVLLDLGQALLVEDGHRWQ